MQAQHFKCYLDWTNSLFPYVQIFRRIELSKWQKPQYRSHVDCITLQVDFSDFAMETHPNCGYDYLEIFNGPYASSPSIGRFCGNTPPTGFHSQSNSIRIVFFTDLSQSAHGFRMTYAFSTTGNFIGFSLISNPSHLIELILLPW